MAFELFCMGLPRMGDDLERLSQSLANHRIISNRQPPARAGMPYMMFCLEYIPKGACGLAAIGGRACKDLAIATGMDKTSTKGERP